MHQAGSCCQSGASGAGSPSSSDGWPRVRRLTAGAAPAERLTNPPVIYTRWRYLGKTDAGFMWLFFPLERNVTSISHRLVI